MNIDNDNDSNNSNDNNGLSCITSYLAILYRCMSYYVYALGGTASSARRRRIYTCTHMYACVYIYIYIYTHIHTYIHTLIIIVMI